MTKAAGQPEDIVKARLIQFLPQWFHYREEVWEWDHKNRIDFICYPKPALVALGWAEKPFGLEVKGYELEDGRKRTAIRVSSQAMQYDHSTFVGQNGKPVKLDMVLLYPKVSVILGQSEGSPYEDTLVYGLEYGLFRLAAMFRVGELLLSGHEFEVRFNGVRYFDSRRGMAAANPLAAETTRASR